MASVAYISCVRVITGFASSRYIVMTRAAWTGYLGVIQRIDY
jgi:hypothetical protein